MKFLLTNYYQQCPWHWLWSSSMKTRQRNEENGRLVLEEGSCVFLRTSVVVYVVFVEVVKDNAHTQCIHNYFCILSRSPSSCIYFTYLGSSLIHFFSSYYCWWWVVLVVIQSVPVHHRRHHHRTATKMIFFLWSVLFYCYLTSYSSSSFSMPIIYIFCLSVMIIMSGFV